MWFAGGTAYITAGRGLYSYVLQGVLYTYIYIYTLDAVLFYVYKTLSAGVELHKAFTCLDKSNERGMTLKSTCSPPTCLFFSLVVALVDYFFIPFLFSYWNKNSGVKNKGIGGTEQKKREKKKSRPYLNTERDATGYESVLLPYSVLEMSESAAVLDVSCGRLFRYFLLFYLYFPQLKARTP